MEPLERNPPEHQPDWSRERLTTTRDRWQFVKRVATLRRVLAELESVVEAKEDDHPLVRELDRRLTQVYEHALEAMIWARSVRR